MLNILGCDVIVGEQLMSRGLLDLEAYAEKLEEQGRVQVTVPVQAAYSDGYHNVLLAELLPGPYMVVVVGLRSSILEPFERFAERAPGGYLPCDIPSLVSAVAVILTQEEAGLAGAAIIRKTHTSVAVMVQAPDLRELAVRVDRIMHRWKTWTETVLSAVRQEPVNGDWEVEWDEFLAGESGFVVMPWYRVMGVEERRLALRRVADAGKALLVSVLSADDLDAVPVRDIIEWLDGLAPLEHIMALTGADTVGGGVRA